MIDNLIADKFAIAMQAFEPFENMPRIAVAVSGGADSLALCIIAKNWADKYGAKIIGVTFDHKLRDESTSEAAFVADALKGYGIEHHILTWQDSRPETGIEEKARNARFTALEAFCKKEHILHLLVAHHQEDQAETFLIRLQRGSGVDGLSAILPVVETHNIRIIRPLLGFTKNELISVLDKLNQKWVEDPSNQEDDYLRVRIRKHMSSLGDIGLTSKGLSETSMRMARARGCLEYETAEFCSNNLIIFPEGYVRLNLANLKKVNKEIACRVISRIAAFVGAKDYPPRFKQLERLYEALTKQEKFEGCSFSNCVFSKSNSRSQVFICSEYKPSANLVKLYENKYLWNDKFTIILNADLSENQSILPIGDEGWRYILKKQPSLKKNKLPHKVIITLPALFEDGKLKEACFINFCDSEKPMIKGFLYTPKQSLTRIGLRE